MSKKGAAESGFYDWHYDFGPAKPTRKLSISIQLSDSADYDGGDLELMFGNVPTKLDRTRGAFIIFPSFMLHRVTR
jgi:PKHD-type hydroxylase